MRGVVLLLLFFCAIFGGSIVGSKHDLSTSNYYGSSAGTSTEVCVFCHTPHGSNDAEMSGGPIWNRRISDTTKFEMYGGEGSPSFITMLCLSCHDGVANEGDVSAVNGTDGHSVINPNNEGSQNPNCKACHPFARGQSGTYPGLTWRIGPILSNDHPVSIDYANAVATNPVGDFKAVPDLDMKLFGGKVECASCHDVHNSDYGMFLRKSNAQSALCYSCHNK